MINYLRDPEAIYRASFDAVRAATDLGGIEPDLEALAIRLVHAVGQPGIVADLAWSAGAAAAGQSALAAGAPVLVDAHMVEAGIIRARLPKDNPVICRLGDEGVAAAAKTQGTTRSAAAVERWLPDLAGAVVAIGNAPTALFRLLELLDDGAPRPALILGFPVGFIGAAEAKDELVRNPRGVPFIALKGRLGGSALAAASVNALSGGLP